MEEIFRSIGVKVEMWIVSFFSAALFTLYRIYEPENAPTTRKVISMVIMGLISALLVPGLVIHIFKIENVFTAGAVTGITVYGFEQVIALAKGMVLRKLSNEGKDETDN